MEATTIQERIQEIIPSLTMEEQQDVLNFVTGLLQSHEEEVDEAFLEEYNREIDEAIAEVDAGHFFTQEEIEKKYAEWKKR